jgi:hypothetical protein
MYFLRVNQILVNEQRLLAMDHIVHPSEHFVLVFDSGERVQITAEDGWLLLDRHERYLKPSEGITATASERLT